MYIIVYNPKSRGGNRNKILGGVIKAIGNEEYITKSFGEIKNFNEFVDSLKENEHPLVVGGDGTLHYIVNLMIRDNVTKDVYAYSSGTGNDFFRNINKLDKIVKLNDYIKGLPTYKAGANDEHFLNGVGMGLDSTVCKLVSESNGTGAFTYTKNAFKAFFEYKPSKMTAIIDGKQFTYDKCWLITCSNGPYQGGGMVFGPGKERNNGEVGVLFIHDCSLIVLLTLFLSIYKGKQLKYKKYVTYVTGKEVKLIPSKKVYMQTDGEVIEDFKDIIIKG